MKSKNNYLHPEDFERLMAWVRNDLPSRKWEGSDVEFVLRTAYWCQLRMIEALGLQARDFDCDEWSLRLRHTKAGCSAEVPIPPPWRRGVTEFLEGWYGRRAAVAAAAAPDNTPTTSSDASSLGRRGAASEEILAGCRVLNMYRWLRRAGSVLDLEALTSYQHESHEKTICHIFRKTGAKDMALGTWSHNGVGAPLPVVQRALRHKSLSVTAAYLRLQDSIVKNWWDYAGASNTGSRDEDEVALESEHDFARQVRY